jgi:hypothetical protein
LARTYFSLHSERIVLQTSQLPPQLSRHITIVSEIWGRVKSNVDLVEVKEKPGHGSGYDDGNPISNSNMHDGPPPYSSLSDLSSNASSASISDVEPFLLGNQPPIPHKLHSRRASTAGSPSSPCSSGSSRSSVTPSRCTPCSRAGRRTSVRKPMPWRLLYSPPPIRCWRKLSLFSNCRQVESLSDGDFRSSFLDM